MELGSLFIDSLKESLVITGIIFVLMVAVEIVVLKFQDRLLGIARRNRYLGYLISSFFGIIPGCIGTFAMDSLYMTGLLGFGGIIAVMVATSGDEAFIMLGMAAKGEISTGVIIMITASLFALGIIGGMIADYFKRKTNMKFCERCTITHHKGEEFKIGHFFKKHLYSHIIKKHLWQIFLWLFAAIFVIGLLQGSIQLSFEGKSLFFILLIASLVGVLPISGPNVFLIVLFSEGVIPFSVLLANSIIQDGHGLLPIMGFSMDDAVKIKVFNFIFGFAVGLALLLLGF